MSWVYLDDKFHSNPKVVAAGNAGAGLFARSLSYCGDHLTDGFVPIAWARGAGSGTLRAKLVEAGLWVEVSGGYEIPDYLTLNPSKQDVIDKRAKRSEAGKAGAKARWGDGKHDGKSHSTSYGSSYANPMAKGLGLNQQKGVFVAFDVNEVAGRWLEGAGWDETFDQDAIVEELQRIARKPGAQGTLNEFGLLKRWRELRTERFGVAA